MQRNTLAILLAIVFAAPLVAAIGSSGTVGSNAANKTQASGSSLQYLQPDGVDSDLGVTLLTTTIKTSKPTDLLLQVSLECALWTTVTSSTEPDQPMGIDTFSSAEARVLVWIEVDGVAVKVDSNDPNGKISFCNRVHEQEITDMDDSTGNWTISQYLATRDANAFNWYTLNVGSGVHTVVVKADIESEVDGPGALAQGGIGKRTLIVEPTRFANSATVY